MSFIKDVKSCFKIALVDMVAFELNDITILQGDKWNQKFVRIFN